MAIGLIGSICRNGAAGDNTAMASMVALPQKNVLSITGVGGRPVWIGWPHWSSGWFTPLRSHQSPEEPRQPNSRQTRP